MIKTILAGILIVAIFGIAFKIGFSKTERAECQRWSQWSDESHEGWQSWQVDQCHQYGIELK